MENNHNFEKWDKVFFSYKVHETKYYLLTGGSGYPLAEFNYPYLSEKKDKAIVIPEDRL